MSGACLALQVVHRSAPGAACLRVEAGGHIHQALIVLIQAPDLLRLCKVVVGSLDPVLLLMSQLQVQLSQVSHGAAQSLADKERNYLSRLDSVKIAGIL